MKKLIALLFVIEILAVSGFAQTSLQEKSITLADPAIFFYKKTYYLYGTGGGNSGNGFPVYTSGDLKEWKLNVNNNLGYALQKGDAFGTSGFWAPQVFLYNKKIFMAYVANENIAIAVSDFPAGPFSQKIKQPLAAPVKQIDPFVFIDDDGKKYLYHVRLTNGNRLFVAEMKDDLSAIKEETLKECITATEPWENTANAKWPVAEGPSVIKHKNLYYLFYTANDFRNPDYAVGYAVSRSPYGPWKKFEGNPIISRNNIGKNGTGHGDFVIDKNGNMLYVFHTHFSETKVAPRKTAIVKLMFTDGGAEGEDKVTVDPKSFYYLEVK